MRRCTGGERRIRLLAWEEDEEIDRYPDDFALRCFDPEGREVVARLGRWQSHIKVRHAELDDHFAAVQRAIEAPYRIVQDKTYVTRLNYYRFGVLPQPYDRLFLKVCVEYSGSDQAAMLGDVVTAYPTRRVDPKETQQWP